MADIDVVEEAISIVRQNHATVLAAVEKSLSQGRQDGQQANLTLNGCPHGVRYRECPICQPTSPNKPSVQCEHGRWRRSCFECFGLPGNYLCPHRKRRSNCLECSPHRKCPHGRVKGLCRRCDVVQCSHGVPRSRCGKCSQHARCAHGKHRHRCTLCSNAAAARTPHCAHGVRLHSCDVCAATAGRRRCVHGVNRRDCSLCSSQKKKSGAPRKHRHPIERDAS